MGNCGIGDVIVQHHEYGTDVNAIKYTDKYTNGNCDQYTNTDAITTDDYVPGDCRSGRRDDELCGGGDGIVGLAGDLYFADTEHLYGEWEHGDSSDTRRMPYHGGAIRWNE